MASVEVEKAALRVVHSEWWRMKYLLLLLSIVLGLSAVLPAQDAIPAGTILPVELRTAVKSQGTAVGRKVNARLMQDVPLPGGSRIRQGARISGHVVAATSWSPGAPARVTIRFDSVADGQRRFPIVTNLRALASMLDVFDAQTPENGPDRGTSEDAWTTDQIGGEVLFRGTAVFRGSNLISTTTFGSGVLVRAASRPGTKCRAAVAGNAEPQALWIFSSDACGLYGYPDLILAHAGRSEPSGEITLQSLHGEVNLRAGSGLLLRVNRAGTIPPNLSTIQPSALQPVLSKPDHN